LLDDYAPYLRHRWNQGCTDINQLFAEVSEQGLTVLADMAVPLEEFDRAQLAGEIKNTEEDAADAADDTARARARERLEQLTAHEAALSHGFVCLATGRQMWGGQSAAGARAPSTRHPGGEVASTAWASPRFARVSLPYISAPGR
jgi:hypothetical protein